jgi:endo-1,4-beta-xylanase
MIAEEQYILNNRGEPMGREFSHRMATKTLAVMNPDGTPAAGKALKITQTRHSFLFGCGAFDALEIAQTSDPARKEFLTERMEKWLALFNFGTLPFYWGRYEPVEGQDAGEAMMKAALWLRERGVTLKGHPLCWHTVCADWLMQYPNGVILEKQLARIRRDVGKFKGVIDMWDVVNEAVIMPVFDKHDNAVTRICKDLGRVELIRRTFAAAREAGPGAVLLLNDFNTSAEFALLLEACLDAGIPIGAIGIQSHQHQGYWGLKKLREVLARFAHYGLPIHFTENTLLSGNLMPREYDDLNDYKVSEWPSTPEGEDRQAREILEMYTELFRHPQVEAVTAWDFTDGKWLGAPSGLLRKDNSCKPAYFALMEKIKGGWWTDEEVVTDDNGEARFEGFMGEYEVTGAAGKGTFRLEREGFKTVVTLGEPAG